MASDIGEGLRRAALTAPTVLKDVGFSNFTKLSTQTGEDCCYIYFFNRPAVYHEFVGKTSGPVTMDLNYSIPAWDTSFVRTVSVKDSLFKLSCKISLEPVGFDETRAAVGAVGRYYSNNECKACLTTTFSFSSKLNKAFSVDVPATLEILKPRYSKVQGKAHVSTAIAAAVSGEGSGHLGRGCSNSGIHGSVKIGGVKSMVSVVFSFPGHDIIKCDFPVEFFKSIGHSF